MVWSTFCPRPNGQFLALKGEGEGGVRTIGRMVCALLAPFDNVNKQMKKLGPKKNTRCRPFECRNDK